MKWVKVFNICFHVGMVLSLVWCMVSNHQSDVKRKELNQRYEKMIEQDENDHKKNIERLQAQFIEREEWHAERKTWHQEYMKEVKKAIKRLSN